MAQVRKVQCHDATCPVSPVKEYVLAARAGTGGV